MLKFMLFALSVCALSAAADPQVLVTAACVSMPPRIYGSVVLKDDGHLYRDEYVIGTIGESDLRQIQSDLEYLKSAPVESLQNVKINEVAIETRSICSRGILDISYRDPRLLERVILQNSVKNSMFGLADGSEQSRRARAIILNMHLLEIY